MAKFRGDRPRDRGDLALNKKERKEKKETAAKHKGSRVALSQRAALVNGERKKTRGWPDEFRISNLVGLFHDRNNIISSVITCTHVTDSYRFWSHYRVLRMTV